MISSDTRNVIDEFKGMAEKDIIRKLDERGVQLEIAIENTLRDYNMGTIVRTANAFGVRTVHIIGRRQWNKRGAMMTDKYLHVEYHTSFSDFGAYAASNFRPIVAIDNVANACNLDEVPKDPRAILLFGQEGPGLSTEALSLAANIVQIEQTGSTRSINVGVAAGVVMYTWLHSN